MFSAEQFTGVQLVNGLSIATVTLVDQPIENLFGYRALGRTRISHRTLYILIASQISDEEKSVTLYHEVLESAIVATRKHRCPSLILERRTSNARATQCMGASALPRPPRWWPCCNFSALERQWTYE